MTIKLAIAVLAGGIAAQHSRVLISWDQCLPILVALGVLFCLRRARLPVAFLTGFILLHLAASLIIDERLDDEYAGDSMLVAVRVIDFPKVSGATTTLIVAPVSDSRLPPTSRVSWFEAPVRPALGDTWQFELRLKRPRGAANPGGFDSERWMFRERIHATGYVVPGKRNRLLRSPELGPIERIQSSFVQLAAVAPDSGGVIAAVAVGVRHGIDADRWDRYAHTGTSHLVAISGLHVGLAAVAAFTVVFAVSVLLCRFGNPVRHATIGAVLLASAYAVVSGLGIPAQRAMLMLALAAVAIMAGRRIRPGQVVALCALAVFLADPIASLAPGFALSFGAVVLLYRAAADFRAGNSLTNYLRGLCTAQLLLFFGLLPLTDLYFNRVALLAPVVNIIVVPLFSLITVPASLLAVVSVALDLPTAEFCIQIADVGVRIVNRVVDAAANLPVAGSTLAKRDGVAAAVPWLTMLWAILPQGWPGRALAILAIACLLQPEIRRPQSGCVDIHALDVGQGQSIVVQSAHHTLVYDTGPAYRSGGSAAEHVLAPFLEYLGVPNIDWLIISHGDLDHAGGVRHLGKSYRIDRLFTSEQIGIDGLNEFSCRSGQRWRADGVEFTVLHPQLHGAVDGNDGSCVLEIAVGGRRALLTGDIETAAEQRLLERDAVRHSVFVTVPHHGSQTSSSSGFINRIDPEVAVTSAGYRNRWNFPSERVRRRWEGAGAQFYETGVSGAVSVTMCRWRAPRKVREERKERQRFWHDDASP